MVISPDKDVRLCISDIETMAGLIDLGFYNPDIGEWYEFEISEYRNDMYDFVKFYSRLRWDYMVGFNYIGFDAQVIQFILDNHIKWFNLTNIEIIERVYKFVQNLIDDQKYGLFKPYREDKFEIAVLDVFTILGLDNEARYSSLKKLEFNLDMENVEEMPIHHSVKNLSIGDIALVKAYRRNDVVATLEVFKLVMGDTNHPLYRGNNQLELRFSIKEEFNIPCMSYSDIKIGEELLKIEYCKEKNIGVKDLKKKGTFRKGIDMKRCIPSYISFKTPILKNLHSDLIKTFLKKGEKWERKFKIGKTTYVQGIGGLHSVNNGNTFRANDLCTIETIDVSSMYPASIVNNGYYPYHLGKELLIIYKKLYERRIELKPLAKKDKKIKGIVDALKLVLNSCFGKMGSMESWLYDFQCLCSVTLTGQFSLLMLIEELELNGLSVVVANTDGVEVIVPKDKYELFDKICRDWESITGYVLEGDVYKSIFMSTVNDYLAITTSDKPKMKGDMMSDFELHKNKSSRVVPLALQEYFIRGKDPIDFITNHQNIYDFCIMAKATGTLHLEMQKHTTNVVTREMLEKDGWLNKGDLWKKEELEDNNLVNIDTAKSIYRSSNPVEMLELKKLVRYYLSDKSLWFLYKRGIGSTGKEANTNLNAPNELGNIYIQYFNKYEKKPMDEYCVSKKHYILKCLKIIDKIEHSDRAKRYIASFSEQKQLSLF